MRVISVDKNFGNEVGCFSVLFVWGEIGWFTNGEDKKIDKRTCEQTEIPKSQTVDHSVNHIAASTEFPSNKNCPQIEARTLKK